MEFKKKKAEDVQELIQLMYQKLAIVHYSAGIGFS